jgi:hypothetical protein
MVAVDWGKCAVAIEAACFWTLSLTPPNNRKIYAAHLLVDSEFSGADTITSNVP